MTQTNLNSTPKLSLQNIQLNKQHIQNQSTIPSNPLCKVPASTATNVKKSESLGQNLLGSNHANDCPLCGASFPSSKFKGHYIACWESRTQKTPQLSFDTIAPQRNTSVPIHADTNPSEDYVSNCFVCHKRFDNKTKQSSESLLEIHLNKCLDWQSKGKCSYCKLSIPEKDYLDHVRQCAAIENDLFYDSPSNSPLLTASSRLNINSNNYNCGATLNNRKIFKSSKLRDASNIQDDACCSDDDFAPIPVPLVFPSRNNQAATSKTSKDCTKSKSGITKSEKSEINLAKALSKSMLQQSIEEMEKKKKFAGLFFVDDPKSSSLIAPSNRQYNHSKLIPAQEALTAIEPRINSLLNDSQTNHYYNNNNNGEVDSASLNNCSSTMSQHEINIGNNNNHHNVCNSLWDMASSSISDSAMIIIQDSKQSHKSSFENNDNINNQYMNEKLANHTVPTKILEEASLCNEEKRDDFERHVVIQSSVEHEKNNSIQSKQHDSLIVLTPVLNGACDIQATEIQPFKSVGVQTTNHNNSVHQDICLGCQEEMQNMRSELENLKQVYFLEKQQLLEKIEELTADKRKNSDVGPSSSSPVIINTENNHGQDMMIIEKHDDQSFAEYLGSPIMLIDRNHNSNDNPKNGECEAKQIFRYEFSKTENQQEVYFEVETLPSTCAPAVVTQQNITGICETGQSQQVNYSPSYSCQSSSSLSSQVNIGKIKSSQDFDENQAPVQSDTFNSIMINDERNVYQEEEQEEYEDLSNTNDFFIMDNNNCSSFVVEATQQHQYPEQTCGMIFKNQEESAIKNNSCPEYQAMSLQQLKKIAQKYGISSGMTKQALVAVLVRIWHTLNSETTHEKSTETKEPNSTEFVEKDLELGNERRTNPLKKRKIAINEGEFGKVSNKEEREAYLMRIIKSHSDIYSQILRYQPIQITELIEAVNSGGNEIGRQVIVKFLDEQGISFR